MYRNNSNLSPLLVDKHTKIKLNQKDEKCNITTLELIKEKISRRSVKRV